MSRIIVSFIAPTVRNKRVLTTGEFLRKFAKSSSSSVFVEHVVCFSIELLKTSMEKVMSDMADMIKEIVGLLKRKVKIERLSLTIKFACLLFLSRLIVRRFPNYNQPLFKEIHAWNHVVRLLTQNLLLFFSFPTDGARFS